MPTSPVAPIGGGEEYFRRGAVEIVNQGLTGLTAAVQGSASVPYIVELDWSKATRETLFVSCSCPRFDDVGVCKHVFATILAADAAGLGESVPGRTALYLEPNAAALERFADANEDEYAFDDDGDDDGGTRRPSNAGSAGGYLTHINHRPPNVLKAAQPSRKAKSPPVSQWKKTLSAMEQRPTNGFPRTRDARRSSRGKSGTCWTWQNGESRLAVPLALPADPEEDGTLGNSSPSRSHGTKSRNWSRWRTRR